MKYDAIVLAAGSGKRMAADKNKILLTINGKPVFQYSLEIFLKDSDCKQIFLVGKAEEEKFFEDHLDDKITFVIGGAERQDSVRNALAYVQADHVMIHDGARPFVGHAEIGRLKEQVNSILAVPVKDTIKEVSDSQIEKTVPREHLYAAQTPQFFESDLIKKVHKQAFEDSYLGTDDASLVEIYSSIKVKIVEGSYNNIKLTTPEDMLLGELTLERVINNG